VILWYAASAAGVVAYLLLSGSVALGATLAGKERLERWPRFALEEVHRFLSLLAGTFVAIHVLAILLDRAAHFSLSAALVPFASSYRPLATALGIVAAELMVAIAVTNRLRKRLPYRLWRRAHYLTLLVWLGATAHGLAGGTDRGAAWFVFVYLGTAIFVGGLVARSVSRRLAQPAGSKTRKVAPAPGADSTAA
jgi:sulfoxide reductase heme-binding subunit YedZ